jgi:hypothetical protein
MWSLAINYRTSVSDQEICNSLDFHYNDTKINGSENLYIIYEFQETEVGFICTYSIHIIRFLVLNY